MSINLSQTTSQRQVLQQRLVLTQELQLFLKLIQMTTLELKDYLEEQLIENPILVGNGRGSLVAVQAEDQLTNRIGETLKDVLPRAVQPPAAEELLIVGNHAGQFSSEQQIGFGEPHLRSSRQRVGHIKHVEAVGEGGAEPIDAVHPGKVAVQDGAGALGLEDRLPVADLQFGLLSGVRVEIDIKPGSDPNSINSRSNGDIPVAILATADYDPLDVVNGVDPETVLFAGAGNAHPNQPLGHWEDVDGDGDTDLLLHFNTQDVFNDADGLSCGDTEAVLTGFTYEGVSIEGVDFVLTVACN